MNEDSLAELIRQVMNEGLQPVNAKLDSLGRRFDSLETRFDTLDNRFDNLETQVYSLQNGFDGLKGQFCILEQKVDTVIQHVNSADHHLVQLMGTHIPALREQNNAILEVAVRAKGGLSLSGNQ